MARTAVAAVPLVLVPALAAAQGGFHPDAWVWGGALAAWAAALALAVGAPAAFLRREWPWIAVAAALLLWTLLTTLWSAAPAQSVLEARRMVVYAAVVLALVVLTRRDSAQMLVAATYVAVSGVVLYALARYLAERRNDPVEAYLLAQPLGYANAVGILAVLALLLSLAPLVEGRRTAARATAAAAMPPLALALELTGSNASWLALAVGALAVVFLHPAPLSLVRPALAVVPVTAAVAVVGHLSRLTELTTAPRLGGPLVGLVAVGGAAAAAAATAALRPEVSQRRLVRRQAVAIVAAILVVAGGAIGAARAGSTEPRSSYYHVAWREYRTHPLLGSGAGTFGRYWLRLGSPVRLGGALDAHSLYLETLAELGPVGLLLLLGFLLAPLRHTLAHRGVPGVPAAAGATVAFLVHAGLDWDWELPAVVVAALACSAAVALAEPAGRDAEQPPAATRWGRRAALAGALALGAAAIAGARSTTEPSAVPHGVEATPGAASLHHLRGVTG